MEWKWTKGEPYERSRRLKHVQELENKEFSKEMDTSAYTSSLNYDENTWELLNQNAASSGFTPLNLQGQQLPINDIHQFKISNKREELDTKIADRDMVQQIGFNPFLGESSYVNDVSIRDQFLKPINTTQGATRASASE